MDNRLRSIAISSLFGTVLTGFCASASGDTALDLVEALVKKGVLSAQEAEVLQQQSQASQVSVGNKGLVVKSADGAYSMKVGGRLHIDASGNSDDGLAPGVKPINGTEIRRGRIYLSGAFNNDWGYHIETDFGGNKVSAKDFLVTYSGFEAPIKLTIGNQKHAMSMEIEESSNDIMFTERSLVAALTTPYFDRAIGFSVAAGGGNWHVKSGVYGDAMASGGANANEGNGFGVRGTYAPIAEKNKVLHIGVNYGLRKPSEDGTANGKATAFSYKTTNLSGLKPVNAAFDNMDQVKTSIVELAAMFGPVSVQSEFAQTQVSRDAGPDVDLSASYVQVGFTVAGRRVYKASEGEFKHLTQNNNFSLRNGTWGAWELALRLDQIDLEDADITGGEAKRASLALNWYLNPNVRVMLDYSTSYELNGGALIKADGSYADDIDVYALRTQWSF